MGDLKLLRDVDLWPFRCVDFRHINRQTLYDSHPIGHIDDNLVRLSKSKIFSTVDGCGAFLQVPLEEESKDVTCFATPWGSYRFAYLPFGLSGGPSCFARMALMVLQGIPTSMALPFLDDILIHSPDPSGQMVALDKVLTAVGRAGLLLKPEKCYFWRRSVKYLGFIVSAEGISPVPEYVKVVKEWPLPRNRHEIRVFCGKANYYKKFIKSFAALARPLTDLLKQDGHSDKEPLELTRAEREAFNKLKEALLRAPVLAYPRFDSEEPFILDCDWSADNGAVGAVLSQVQDGRERVIAYAGKKLNRAQAAYGSHKGELAGVIIFVRHWSYYLKHRPFLLRVDNQALKWIHSMEEPSGMIQRWLQTLANHNFTVQHRTSRQHSNADSISRAPHVSDNRDVDVSLGEMMCALERIPQARGPPEGHSFQPPPDQPVGKGPILALAATKISTEEEELSEAIWNPKSIRQHQQDDPDTAILFKFLDGSGKTPTDEDRAKASDQGRLYIDLLKSLALDNNGVIRFERPQTMIEADRGREREGRKVILMPNELRFRALKLVHESAAHLGRDLTVDRAQKFMFFPNMSGVAAKVIRHCRQCQQKAGALPPQKHSLHSRQEFTPMSSLSLDFVGPLPRSTQGNSYLFTARCVFTRWTEAFPVKTATAKTAVDILLRELIPRWAIPSRLHSDNASSFTSDLLHDVAKALKVKLTHSPPYVPRAQPVERAHRDLKAAIKSLTEGRQHEWEEVLPEVLFALRTAKCRTTGFSPFQLMFARDPNLPLDLIFGGPPTTKEDYRSHEEYAEALRYRFQRAYQWARDNISSAITRQRQYYYKDKIMFHNGEKVWLFHPNLKPKTSSKFPIRWTGPWTVLRKINDVLYEVKPDPRWNRQKTEVVAVDRLKKYYEEELEDDDSVPPPKELDVGLAGDEFAQNLGSEAGDLEDLGEPEGLLEPQAVIPHGAVPLQPPHPPQVPPQAAVPPQRAHLQRPPGLPQRGGPSQGRRGGGRRGGQQRPTQPAGGTPTGRRGGTTTTTRPLSRQQQEYQELLRGRVQREQERERQNQERDARARRRGQSLGEEEAPPEGPSEEGEEALGSSPKEDLEDSFHSVGSGTE